MFEGLGEVKGVQHKIQIDSNAIPVVHPSSRVPVALREPLKEELQREWTSWESLRNGQSLLPVYTVLWLPRKRVATSECAWILATSIVQTVEDVITECPMQKVFSVLDANHGLGSSKLATFNIPLFFFFFFFNIPHDLHYIALHYTTLHYITLHYLTLHDIL